MSANEPVTRGSYGTIFMGQGKGHTGREPLQNNVNKLHEELHHKSVADAIQPKRPESFNKYARQVGRLYGIGSDSPVVAHALIAENYSESNPKNEGFIGVRRSALEMVLEGESIDGSPVKAGMNDGSKKKKGGISREFPTEETKSISSYDRFGDVSPVQAKGPKSKHKPDVWNKKGAQPLTITESLYLSDRMEGGRYHIDASKKKDDYTAPMIGAAAGELGNSITTTPKSWPKSVGYTKSINRPHPELDERFQKGVADKACSKSRLGSMRAFNKANSGSIYDTGSGFINPNAGKIRSTTNKSSKSKKGSKEMGQHQKQHQSTYPLGQGPVDDSSVLSFEASYTGHSHSHGYGEHGQYLLDEEDSLTLDGASAASPSAFPGRGAGTGTGDIVGGGGYKVSFDGDLYEGEHRRDRNVLAGFPGTSVDDESKGEGEGHWRAKHQGHQGPAGEQKESGRTPLVLEHEQDIDEYLASRPMDTALVLGDIAVDEIYTHGDSENIADTGVGRTNTAGESPPRKPQAQAQAQARPRHSEMHHADFDDRSVLTDSETVHFVGGSIDMDTGGHTQGKSAVRGGVQAGAAASTMARQRGGMSNKDRVYAVDYGDHKEGIVVPGSREGGKRRGGISVGLSSSPGAADHRHYPDDGSSIATEGVGDGAGGASWINAVGADKPVTGGRVVGFEYRRERYDEQGRPLQRAYHHTEIDDNDTDEHSVGSYRSLNSSAYGLPHASSHHHRHQHHFGSQSVTSEMTGAGAPREFDSRDLVCGKLEVAEKNSATRKELGKSVRRGVAQAKRTVAEHANLLLAGPGGSFAGGRGVSEEDRTRPEGAYVDDATIATAASMTLSPQRDLLLNIPGNITTGESTAGSDTISKVKHALGKKDSPHHLERGGEHAQHHHNRDAHKWDVAGLGNTAAGRFKMRFDDAPAAAVAAANAAAGWVGEDSHLGGSVGQEGRDSPSHVREKKHFNSQQPEHLRWSKLAGQGMEGHAGKPDIESRRNQITQMYEEKKRRRLVAKKARKQQRQEQAEARWHAKMEQKKKERLAQGLDSDEDDGDEDDWSDEEVVVTSDEDEEELRQEEEAYQESLAKAELSALPHDNRYDKQGNLIITNKMTVSSLIGKGPATGEEGSPGARERNKANVAARRKRASDAGGKPLPGSDVTFYNPENNRSYADHLNEHLEVPTEKISGNPFRPTQRQIGRTGAKSVTKIPVPKDTNPLDYKAEATHRRAGRYGIIIKADKTTRGGVPTRNEIQSALSKASRKNLLAYDTRIVETGTLLKAVNHHQRASPGIPAIIDLHKAFVTAAAMNPNPWLLKREQVASVLQDELPWLDGGSLRRLVSAYDPHGTGLIKYVKISTALVCASKPSMANLIVLLSRIEEERQEKARKKEEEERNWDLQQAAADSAKANAERRYKHTSTDTHSHIHDPGTEPLPSGKPRDDGTDLSSASTYTGDYGSEKYLLQLVHGLYEDCEGTNTGRILRNDDRLLPPRTLAAPGCGMRIEDIVEAVSSCACNVEDELVMQSAMAPVVQAVYQAGRAKDTVLSAYDEEQRLAEEDRRAEQIMLEREAKMRELNAGKGGGDPNADDMSSNFTARSGFTPGQGSITPGQGSRSGTARSSVFDPGNKRAAAGSRYGDGYQPRWPQHSRSGSTSMVRDPHDRFSGAGMHGASAKQVTKFMNRSRASEEEAALWTKGKEKDGYHRKHMQGGGPRDSVVRGGDSVAWDDESLAASSLASAGAVTTAAGGGGLKKVIRGGRRANTGGHPSNRSTASTSASNHGPSKYLPDGRLAATHALKHASIKDSLHVPRVEQATFVSCMVDNSVAMETFVHQLDKFRRALEPYVIGGTIAYEESVNEGISYGSRIPHRNSAMR